MIHSSFSQRDLNCLICTCGSVNSTLRNSRRGVGEQESVRGARGGEILDSIDLAHTLLLLLNQEA
jgi:hypothetical protein